jgi:hypothetical protein
MQKNYQMTVYHVMVVTKDYFNVVYALNSKQQTNALKEANMITIIAIIVATLCSLYLCIQQMIKYKHKVKQDNDTAGRHFNYAMVFGFLCIMFISLLCVGHRDFLSNNIHKPIVNEGIKINADAFRITQVDGPLKLRAYSLKNLLQ